MKTILTTLFFLPFTFSACSQKVTIPKVPEDKGKPAPDYWVKAEGKFSDMNKLIKQLEEGRKRDSLVHERDSETILTLRQKVEVLQNTFQIIPEIEFSHPYYLIPVNKEKTKFKFIRSETRPPEDVLNPKFPDTP